MEFILFLLIGGAALGLGLLQHHSRLHGWKEAATSCGLQVVEASAIGPELKARTEPVEVQIEACGNKGMRTRIRSEEHTSELQSRLHLVCRLLLEKKKKK